MPKRVIDSNILLDLWHGRRPSSVRKKVRSASTAREVVDAWLRDHPDDGILTPIRLELIGGGLDRDEVQLTDFFLGLFPVFDDGDVRLDDWVLALRLAKRVPYDPEPRGAIDCLIRAICKRLGAELKTRDTGMPPD